MSDRPPAEPASPRRTQSEWDAIVSAAIREVEITLLKPRPGFHQITHFGAMDIHPKHLAIWCFFKKDKHLRQAEQEHFTDTLQSNLQEALRKHGYPVSLLPSTFISYATDEDVQRTSGGNYWYYLK